MRFLLNPTTQRTAGQSIQKGRVARKIKETVQTAPVAVTSTSAITPSGDANYVQSWGQQCSPNCGCVIRFEARLDPSTNRYTSASYHAKSVVVTPSTSEDKNGNLEPVMTFRNNKPMFKPCSCPSLHKLATEVTQHLPNKEKLALGSSMEFTGVRASPAFRHTVLEKQGLETSDTHCFDLVEEALTAMVKGHMPKSRPQITPKQIYAKAVSGPNDRQRKDYQFQFDMRSFWEPPRAMSALQLMDVTAKYSPFGFSERDHHDDDTRYNDIRAESKDETASKSYDWVSYVDEKYAEQQSA